MGRKSYERSLDKLQESISELMDKSAQRVEWGVEALRNKDEDLARELRVSDDEINRLYIEVEKRCTDLLALHQPVAKDLRYVTAVFKISTDLERMGDLAVNLGEYTLEGGRKRIMPDVDVVSLGEYAADMVRGSIDSFKKEDLDGAIRLIQRDDEMDQMCRRENDKLLDNLMKSKFEEGGEEFASTVTTVLLSIRDLERVADHAVNLSARTVYMLSSDRRYI